MRSLPPLSLVLRVCSLAAFALVVGCESAKAPAPATVDPSVSPATGDEQEIVDIASTPVKNQSIGNCWVYATTAWAESLHLRGTGQTKNLSESWVTYWDWYDKLVSRGSAGSEKIEAGGFFQSAVAIMGKYGMVEEGAFIEGEAESDRSSAQGRAESAINASMSNGALKKSRSPEVVRAELDKAFGLSAPVVANMTATFGAGAPRPIGAVPKGFALHTADALQVAHKTPGKAATVVPLRTELSGWEEISPANTPDRRKLIRRVQKALHDGQPAIVVWNVSWAARSGATFAKMGATNKVDGVHMTLLEDYQAALVPNFGTLPAGVTVTDPRVLDAALANQVEVSFFRVKNSWGASGDPSGSGNYKGYVDLYQQYLFPTDAGAPQGVVSFVIPRAYDGLEPAGLFPDLCGKAPGAATGTYCAQALSGKPDVRLLTCDTGYTSAMSVCGGGCSGSPASQACGGAPQPAANPCTKAAQGAGPYCGSALGLASNAPGSSALFSCQKDPVSGLWISPSKPCAGGCLDAGPGSADRCK